MSMFSFFTGVAFGCIFSAAVVLYWLADGLDDQGEEIDKRGDE